MLLMGVLQMPVGSRKVTVPTVPSPYRDELDRERNQEKRAMEKALNCSKFVSLCSPKNAMTAPESGSKALCALGIVIFYNEATKGSVIR